MEDVYVVALSSAAFLQVLYVGCEMIDSQQGLAE